MITRQTLMMKMMMIIFVWWMVFFSTLDESEPRGDRSTSSPPLSLHPPSPFILHPPTTSPVFSASSTLYPSLKVCHIRPSFFFQCHNFSSAHLLLFLRYLPFLRHLSRVDTSHSAPLAADPVQTVVVVSVQGAAVCRRGVEVSAQQPVDHSHQDLLVLLPQEGVGEGVRRCFAVAQALADDSPVAVHVHGGQELSQPAGEGRQLQIGDVWWWMWMKNRCDGTGQLYQVDFHIHVPVRCPFSRFYHQVWQIHLGVKSLPLTVSC